MTEEGQERLLILDDESTVGQTIASIARASGMEAMATSHADQFFWELEMWRPTVIALDLIMPDTDGVEILRLLAEKHCSARVIITSGVGGRVLSAARRTAASFGLDVVAVMPKPFSASELRIALYAGNGCPPDLPQDHVNDEYEPSEAELRLALANGELEVAYQPLIACSAGDLAGFEALARWRHPARGMIMPGVFIPLAETTGLIDAVTEQVLSQALCWLSRAFPDDRLTLSINISARSLLKLNLGDRALGISRCYNIAPERLIFELTESSAMEDPRQSLHLMTRLRTQGFQLSIDDFGTGYSSMLQLVRLPFSEIKVDKSFVMAGLQSEESRAVIRSIVDLGRSLGLRTVAEGVDEHGTLAFLKTLGCDRAQGFLIAKPMHGTAALDWACRARNAADELTATASKL